MSASQAQRHELAPRPVRFDWTHTDLHWLSQHPFAAHFINVLHLLLPEGEKWFCKVYGKALSCVGDPRLKRDVQGFIRQEAIHGTSHRAVLEHYFRRFGIDTRPYTGFIRWLFTTLLGERPLGMAITSPRLLRHWLTFQLGIISAIEHFTCVLGHWILGAHSLEEAGADPVMLDLLRWHGAEEVEHRHVAHDLFVHLGGSYPYRVALMLQVAPVLLVLWLWGVHYLLARDPRMPRTFVLLGWHRAAKQGLLPSFPHLFAACVRYLRLRYHPVHEAETRQALAYLTISPAARALEARATVGSVA